MITRKQVHEVQEGEVWVAPTGRGAVSSTIVEDFVNQISDVIFGLIKSRPAPAEGCDWLSFDAAIRGLHGAIVALEDMGTTDQGTRRHPW